MLASCMVIIILLKTNTHCCNKIRRIFPCNLSVNQRKASMAVKAPLYHYICIFIRALNARSMWVISEKYYTAIPTNSSISRMTLLCKDIHYTTSLEVQCPLEPSHVSAPNPSLQVFPCPVMQVHYL